MRREAKIVLGLVVGVGFAPISIAAPVDRTPVELWNVGDDGLTLRLVEAIRAAFIASPDFIVSSGTKPGSLYVGTATNVHWKEVESRTRVTAQIEVRKAPPFAKPIYSGDVSCWSDEMNVCANEVVNLAARLR